MNIPIRWPADALFRTVELPGSKSISNRLLILQALSDAPLHIRGLSVCDDTRIMQEALRNPEETVHAGAAGTAMRFLTAYFAATCQRKTLLGTGRMNRRPIGGLTDALNALGAGVSFLQQPGFPPLRTSGQPMHGGHVSVSGAVSSQFISALLMTAPVLPGGLVLDIHPPVRSYPYIGMTLQLMHRAGIMWSEEEDGGGLRITVPCQPYQGGDFDVEPDWSAASYWYSAAALSGDFELTLQGLRPDSLQGDALVRKMFEPLGVRTMFNDQGARLTRCAVTATRFDADFSDCPDLVQTLAVTLCLLHIPFRFTGTESLRIKETDRIEALGTELRKLGYLLETKENGVIACDSRPHGEANGIICINPHDDHRMALSFAPAAIRMPLSIADPEVISKSYPEFWRQALRLS